MKNSEKILFAVGLCVCVAGIAAYPLLGSATSSEKVAKKAPTGAEVVAWTDESDVAAKDAVAPGWTAPAFDVIEGWNYDLFSSPEISWDGKQKKYFAKELPPAPEEVFGLELKSLSQPKFRLLISSYSAGTKPVPENTAPGRYAAILTISDISGARPQTKIVNFAAISVQLLDETPKPGVRTVELIPENPVTIPGTNAKLAIFCITQKTDSATGVFSEDFSATVIDESGRAPRKFVIGTQPVYDKDRTEAVFTDGSTEWLYSETRVPGKKDVVREIATRPSANAPFEVIGTGNEIHVGDDIFRINGLDISAREARIVKQSAELDKKTKAPKTTERVLSATR